jgi:hypothetical protein
MLPLSLLETSAKASHCFTSLVQQRMCQVRLRSSNHRRGKLLPSPMGHQMWFKHNLSADLTNSMLPPLQTETSSKTRHCLTAPVHWKI